MEPNFNPYEADQIEDIVQNLEQLRYDITLWNKSDLGALKTPLDLGPTSLKFIEARLDLGDKTIDLLDEVIANINAIVKVTELLGEWRDWWAVQ